MSWTAPRTWVAGEVVTAALMNTHVRDDLRYLKGLDGAVVFSDGIDLGTNELTVNSLEIVGVDGEVNKTVVEDHTHADGANCGTVDHGALDGRGDDDHTIYALRTIMTTRGDIVYRNATVWARLAKGTEGQVLRMGADDPAWASSIATHEFFVRAQHTASSGTGGAKGDYAAVVIDANGENAVFSIKVPHDFSSLTHCKVLLIPSTTGTIDWTATTDFAAIDEVYNAGSDSDTADGLAMNDTKVEDVDISAAFTGIAADDYIGVTFTVDTLTTTTQVDVIGLVFKYT